MAKKLTKLAPRKRRKAAPKRKTITASRAKRAAKLPPMPGFWNARESIRKKSLDYTDAQVDARVPYLIMGDAVNGDTLVGAKYSVFAMGWEGVAYLCVGCRTFTFNEANVHWLLRHDVMPPSTNMGMRAIHLLTVVNGEAWMDDRIGAFLDERWISDHADLCAWLKQHKLIGKRPNDPRDADK